LKFHSVRPELAVEFIADISIDGGRYRHPVRYLRVRDDLTSEQVPPFGLTRCETGALPMDYAAAPSQPHGTRGHPSGASA